MSFFIDNDNMKYLSISNNDEIQAIEGIQCDHEVEESHDRIVHDDNIEVTTPLSEKTLMRLEKLIERMSNIKLGQNFDDYINVKDYLIGDRPSLLGPRSEGP
ncbi:MAG: hypothetical protein ACKPKO_56515, partial [Candidatus Fonsibacter sp.]